MQIPINFEAPTKWVHVPNNSNEIKVSLVIPDSTERKAVIEAIECEVYADTLGRYTFIVCSSAEEATADIDEQTVVVPHSEWGKFMTDILRQSLEAKPFEKAA